MHHWLLENALVAAALAGLVAVVCRTVRPRPALRHLLWLLVLIKLVTPPIGRWPVGPSLPGGLLELDTVTALPHAPDERAPRVVSPALLTPARDPSGEGARGTDDGVGRRTAPISGSAEASDTANIPAPLPHGRNQEQPSPSSPSWPHANPAVLILLVWALGAVARAAVELVRARRLRGLLTAGVAPGTSLRREVDRCAVRLGMRAPRVVVLPALQSPFVCGLGRATLAWPVGLLEAEGPAARRGVITHELAHIRRRDHLTSWIELAVSAVHWWNPLVPYVRRRLRAAAEEACDAWVLRALPDDRVRYANALLGVTARAGATPSSTGALAMGSSMKPVVEARLRAVLEGVQQTPLTRTGLVGILAVGALVLPGLSRSGEPDENATVVTESKVTAVSRIELVPDLAPPGEALAEWEADVRAIADRLIAARPGAGIEVELVHGSGTRHRVAVGSPLARAHPIGSAAQCLVATLAARLGDDGLVPLDAPVSALVSGATGPSFAATTRQLLEHTAGLGRDVDVTPGSDPIELAASCTLIAGPGVQRRWSPLSLPLVAAAIESATKRPAHELLDEIVLAPLGMTGTTLGPAAWAAGDGAMSNADDLAKFLHWQFQPAARLGGPVESATLRSLQEPVRSGAAGRVTHSLAWDHGWTDDIVPFALRASREGDAHTYVAFSQRHKVGVVVLARGIGDARPLGRAAITGAIERTSISRAAFDALDSGEIEAARGRFAALAAAFPTDGELLHFHGYCLLMRGQDRESIPVYERCWELGYSRITAAYNLACAHAKLGDEQAAFLWLERALAQGFTDERLLLQDPDIAVLRADPRFAELTVEDY